MVECRVVCPRSVNPLTRISHATIWLGRDSSPFWTTYSLSITMISSGIVKHLEEVFAPHRRWLRGGRLSTGLIEQRIEKKILCRSRPRLIEQRMERVVRLTPQSRASRRRRLTSTSLTHQ